MIKEITINTKGKGLYEFTNKAQEIVKSSEVTEGIATFFIRHTSASLIIQENADPSCQRDLENWLERLVPETGQNFTHTMEGADDMPAHIKSVLTQTSISVPIIDGNLVFGTWQGIFVWEHRASSHARQIVLHIT
jgi:secondary thiamine-phosphate synthase enzyme